MPSTRRSTTAASPLRPVSDNVPALTPGKLTPGRKVVALKAELERKDAENEALRGRVAELADALSGLNLVRDKIDADDASVAPSVAATKGGRNKDKGAPVPPKTAYRFYRDAHPGTKAGADTQRTWKECAPEIRQSYEAMATADKERYLREDAAHREEKEALEAYYGKRRQDAAMELLDAHLAAKAALEKVDEKKGKRRAKKDPEAPKRPLSAYMYFVAQNRESVVKKKPDAPPKEVMKTLGEMWGRLEKGPKTKRYDDLAAEDRARYEGEKEAYDAMLAERKMQSEQEKLERLGKDKEEALKLLRSRQAAAGAGASVAAVSGAMGTVAVDEMSVVSDLTKDVAKPKKKKDPNAPKGASSAYIYFTTENRGRIQAGMPEGATQKELLTEVGRQWKELADGEREKYTKKASEDKERYAREMEKYNAEKQ